MLIIFHGSLRLYFVLREPRFVLREVVPLSVKCAIIRVSYIHIAFGVICSVTISQLAST